MNDAEKLRRQIHAVDFSILELSLFLDTHCDDLCAMKAREEYMNQREDLIHTYEMRFGPYVETKNDVRGACWSWIDNPWPWDFERED